MARWKMDKQDIQNLFERLRRRFDRRAPEPLLVFGRRTAPAPGFSRLELDEAGISEQSALDLGLKVDRRRMSSLGTNVENLRAFLARKK